MKRICFLAMLVWLAVTAVSAQQPQPVEWTFSTKMTGKKTGVVTATAKINKGWHMYGLDLPKGGPMPTEWTFDNSKGVEFTGVVATKPAPAKTVDPTWEMELTWWENAVTFSRPFKVTDKKNAVIECKIRYMVCSGESCLPPTTVTHRFVIK